MTTLSKVLREQYRCDWCRTFCELVHAARSYGTAFSKGQKLKDAHERLERAAMGWVEKEWEWSKLVPPEAMLPFSPDGVDNELWRLAIAARKYVLWFYRPAFGPINRPHEVWQRVAMIRCKAFFRQCRAMHWDAPEATG